VNNKEVSIDFRTTQVVELIDWGTVWFNEDSASNIFSFGEMTHITYDNNNEDAFVVQMKKTFKFQEDFREYLGVCSNT